MRRIGPYEYFENRVAEECARAARTGRDFAVLRIQLDADANPQDVTRALSEALRLTDVIGIYAPRAIEVLLVDVETSLVDMIRGRLEDALRTAGTTARIGVAIYPKHGRTPVELVTAAADATRVDAFAPPITPIARGEVVEPSEEPAPLPPVHAGSTRAELRLDSLRTQVEALEKERIRAALKRTAGNQSAAATLLGISRRTLVNRLDAYGFDRPRKGREWSE